jgi:hypothetical protein
MHAGVSAISVLEKEFAALCVSQNKHQIPTKVREKETLFSLSLSLSLDVLCGYNTYIYINLILP